MRVQLVGDDEAAPIVFVHGASNDGTSWAPLVARLAGFRAIVVDRPGCGLSDRLPRSLDDVAALRRFASSFVVDVLDALEIERAHVVATSYGGLLALHGAAAHPDRVDRLALLGWSVGAPIGRVPLVMRLATVPAIGWLMTSVPAPKPVVRSMLRQVGVADPPGAVVDGFRSLLDDTDTMRNELRVGPRLMTLRGMNEEILIPDDVLGAVRAPTLFAWGTADPFGGADVATAFAAKVPGSRLELIDGAGHAAWIDRGDEVASLVRAHLAA